MANRRIKKPNAENAKLFLIDIVKSYYLTTNEEKAQNRNKGALKYLKDTMVGAVVLSPNPVKRLRKESFLNYFRDFVLPSDYDTLISYIDPEQNLKAFLSCPYFWEKDELKNSEWKNCNFSSNSMLIPFFILQDLQRVVEQNLDVYLRQKILSPYDIRERTVQDDNNDAAKELKYMHLVYALQYYEIFMEEFRKLIMDGAEQTEDENKFQTMQELNAKFSECTDEAKKKMLGEELLELTRECAAILNRKNMVTLFSLLYMHHFINLMAILRILIIAEYVNINQGYTIDSKDKNTHRRRLNIERMVSENLLEFDLYFFHYRDNPNLTRIFRELTTTVEESNIIPDMSNQEEMNEFRNNLKMYIEQTRGKKAGERDATAEELLMKSQIALAKPFLCKLTALRQEQAEITV